jgi:Cu/Ag efflux protein CusF
MNSRNSVKISFLIIAFILASFACNSSSKSENVAKQTYRSVGVVKASDKDKSEITIDHEDIPGLMSAMTMDFPLADKNLLKTVKIGDKIEFELERKASEVFVTRIKKIGEVAKEISDGEIYKTNCAKCHGETGEGVEDKGISFLKGHALDHTEKDFIRQVTFGEEDEMPAFKDKLTEKEIADVVKYVREVIQSKADPKDKGTGHQH